MQCPACLLYTSVKEQSEIFEEYDITMSVIDSLLVRTQDSEGKYISAGEASA